MNNIRFKKIILSFVSLLLFGCGSSRIKEDIATQKVESKTSQCNLKPEELKSTLKPVHKKRENLSAIKSMSLFEQDKNYREDMSYYQNYLEDLKSSFNENFLECEDSTKVKTLFNRRADYVNELKLERFISHYYSSYKKRELKQRIKHYKSKNINFIGEYLKLWVKDIDPTRTEISLKLISSKKNIVLPVNAIEVKSYLSSNGVELPLTVLRGISVYDEYGNRYQQTSEPSTLDRITHERFETFNFRVKNFIKTAKIGLIKIKRGVFGNKTDISLKVPLYKDNSVSIHTIIHNNFGLEGLKARSRMCSFRWGQQASSFMPLPVSVEELGNCAIVDLLIGKLERNNMKYSFNEVEKKFSTRLRQKFDLGKNEINKLLQKWNRQSDKDLQLMK